MSTSLADDKTGPEIIDKISEYPTLDKFLDRDPHSKPLSDTELMELITNERNWRARINVKQETTKEMKKIRRKEKAE